MHDWNPQAFGNYHCDTPIAMLDAALEAMKAIEPAPDFVFWLGDQVLVKCISSIN